MLYPFFLKSANSWAQFYARSGASGGFLNPLIPEFFGSLVLWFFDSLGLLESAGSHHTPLGVWIAHFFDISYLVLPCESDELSKCNVSK